MIILICCNDAFSAYTFRRKLIHALIKNGYHVFVLCNDDDYTKKLIEDGISVITIGMNNTNKNILKDILLYQKYRNIVSILDPDIIINYTIKPHLYMSFAARRKDIKIINFVSGLSSLLYSDGLVKRIIIRLYRYISKFTWGYIFLNNDDLNEFKLNNIIHPNNSVFVLNSEGVDLSVFSDSNNLDFEKIKFLFVGRLVKEKGLTEYLEAADDLKKIYPNVEFLVVGKSYDKGKSTIGMDIIKEYEIKGSIKYLGFIEDMNQVYKDVHVIVLPSYREGMPISLIEGLACGKAVIASNVPGSKEIVVEHLNGFSCEAKNVESLKQAMIKYLKLSVEEKQNISLNAYQMSQQYDVNMIVKKQLEIIG